MTSHDDDMTTQARTSRIWLPGRPVPWQRTRQGRVLEPRYRAWKEEAQWGMAASRPFAGPVSMEVTVTADGIEVVTQETTRSRVKYVRGDLDNYIKAVADAAQGFLFENDRQVTEVEARFG